MKNLVTLFIITLLTLKISAQVVSYDDAKLTAINFFGKIENLPSDLVAAGAIKVDSFATYYTKNTKKLKTASLSKEPAFYIINRINKPGYVIISGDTRIREIIAYSNTSSFMDPNPGVKALLNQYVEEISYIKENNITGIDASSMSSYNFSNYVEGTPLLGDISWSQSPYPFNANCPADAKSSDVNGRVPAGCGATALAQILYYYKYPRSGAGSNSYNSSYRPETADFQNSEYKYELMVDQPEYNSQNSQISTLVYHCGVAQNMDYGTNLSGSYIWNIRDALKNNFKYKDCAYHTFSNFQSWTNWKQLITNEITNKRPVLYKASDLLDGGGVHFFIIDGYITNLDLYHVNWGWRGSENDFYSLNLLNPFDLSYEFYHQMIIGIEPLDPDITPPQVMSVACNEGVGDDIIITFNEPIKVSTLNSSNIIVRGEKSNYHDFPISNCYDPNTRKFTVNPNVDFQYGEKVYVTVRTGVQDLVGNNLDGDNNGTPGPDFTYVFSTPAYTHDYSIASISLSKTNPVVDEVIVVSSVIKNLGKVTEPANQKVNLYDNNVKVNTYDYFPSLIANGEGTQSFNWKATAGSHELKTEIVLSGDENSTNNTKSATVYVGTIGNLLIDGEQNPAKDFTISAGKYNDPVLQLQNTGSAAISGNVTKTGTIASWITLTSGSTFSLITGQTLQYTYKISVPTGTALGAYSASISFSYDGGAKIQTVQLTISVVELGNGVYSVSLNSSSVNIDGRHNSSTTLTHTFNSSAGFYLDNDAATTYPSSVPSVGYNMSVTDYNRMYSASWTTNITEMKEASSITGIYIGLTESSKSNIIYQSVNGYTDIMSWIVRGQNTFSLGLTNTVANAANVQWYVSSSSPGFKFTTAGWGKDCAITSADLTTIKDGWNRGRIYFKVDGVTTGGNLKLYNNGSPINTITISSSDIGSEKYIPITSTLTKTSNYYVIMGDPTTNTRATISNIRLEITYYTGDPNLVCTKTLSKNKILVNETVDVSMLFQNIGSNISNNSTYNDSPLPSGLVLFSGNLTKNLGDIAPGVTSTPVVYTIKATTPGVYNFGSTKVTYQNQSKSKNYQTTFNSVSLQVMGGNLIVQGQLSTNEITVGERVNISANISESITNTNVLNAIVQCNVKNVTKNIVYPTFYLVYDTSDGKYKGSFQDTENYGSYEITINAKKDNYVEGNLGSPLILKINPTPFLEITPMSQSVNNRSGIVNYSVSSNILWGISESEDWFQAIKKDNYTIQVDYNENTTPTSRSGNINVTSTQGLSKIISLYQEKCNLEAFGSNVSFTYSGGNANINITSNSNWVISVDSEWIVLSQISGNGNGVIPFTVSTNPINVQRIGKITITGCSKSIDILIIQDGSSIKTPAIGQITQPTCIISTGSVVLNDLPDAGNWTLTRDPGSITTKGSGPSVTVTEIPTGTYTFKVTDATGLTSPASGNVVIDPKPVSPLAPTGNTSQSFCTSISPKVANLVATGTAIAWYSTATGGTALASTTALVNGAHYYASQNNGTCESAARLDVTVTITASPATPANITGTMTVCVGHTTTLKCMTKNGVWSTTTPTIVKVSSTGIVTGLAPGQGIVKYTVTNAGGCSSSVTATVIVNPAVSQPDNFTTYSSSVKLGTSNVTYTVPGVPGVTYKWSYSGRGATITGTTNSVQVSFSLKATSGTLSVIAVNGCGESQPRTLSITLTKSGSLSAITEQEEFESKSANLEVLEITDDLKAYPNPTSGTVTFEFQISDNAKARLDVYALNGAHIARIFDAEMISGIKQTVLYNQSLSTGTYNCVLSWKDKKITIKLVVRK